MSQVMDLMELGSLKGSLVGLPGHSGLSVEQRKRLTIGVELVANPSIVFMVGRCSRSTPALYPVFYAHQDDTCQAVHAFSSTGPNGSWCLQ